VHFQIELFYDAVIKLMEPLRTVRDMKPVENAFVLAQPPAVERPSNTKTAFPAFAR